MKQKIILILTVLAFYVVKAQTYSVSSPNSELNITVTVNKSVSFSVSHNETQVIKEAGLALQLENHGVLGETPKVKKTERNSYEGIITPVVARKYAEIKEAYNELTISFKGNYKLLFRAYNDGVAYRFVTTLKSDITVENEVLTLNFADETTSLFPEEASLLSHYERKYIPTRLDTLQNNRFCSLPVLTKTNDVNVLFTEADVYDYPCMFMQGTGGNALEAKFPNYVLSTSPKPGLEDRSQLVENANFIAKTKGNRAFPWRVFVISNKDKDLVASELVFQLSSPLKLKDTDWIKPGKVAWDWYNANNIYGVDFKAGINNDTYKYYIDFASKYGLEYIILDEGWSKTTTNIKACNNDINVEELVRYGKERNVGVILWLLWEPLHKNMDALALYNSWGVKGVKVDFMQRADQFMVNYYETIAKEAAKNHLLVDFHGSFKPSGLRRAYPNVLTYEGVKGNENNKWSADITPNHNVTLPFTRMVAGPMDFTPGSMVNTTADNHRISFNRPMSLGTRAHQVAMYVVFESPLQMLCESPSTYYKEAGTTAFISRIPSVWGDTIVLEAKVSDYILMARKNKGVWYVGGMTDETARTFNIALNFLEQGTYKMEIFKDGFNTGQYAQDYVKETIIVEANQTIELSMAADGGFAAILTKQN